MKRKKACIQVGCRVSALVGPFQAAEVGQRRRKRAQSQGIVVASAPDGRWQVYWDRVQKVSNISRKCLKHLLPPNPALMREKSDVQQLLAENHVGGQEGLDSAFATNNPPVGGDTLGVALLSNAPIDGASDTLVGGTSGAVVGGASSRSAGVVADRRDGVVADGNARVVADGSNRVVAD